MKEDFLYLENHAHREATQLGQGDITNNTGCVSQVLCC